MTLDEAQNMLKQVQGELSPRELKRSIKGALLKEARRIRRGAVSYLRSAAVFKGGKRLHNASAVAKGIRAKVYRDFSGLIVAANPKGKMGYHTNQRGKLKPVLMWANRGAANRVRKGAKGGSGVMPAIDFIGKAQQRITPDSLRNIVLNYQSNVLKIIRKHGGK